MKGYGEKVRDDDIKSTVGDAGIRCFMLSPYIFEILYDMPGFAYPGISYTPSSY